MTKPRFQMTTHGGMIIPTPLYYGHEFFDLHGSGYRDTIDLVDRIANEGYGPHGLTLSTPTAVVGYA